MGLFDWLKKKNSKNTIQYGSVTLSHSIEVTKNPVQEKIAALHREATTHKVSNWPAAVACLQEAVDLMRQHPSDYVLDRWTRLPVFMQQAGQFDEAMQEFERLLSEVEERVKQECQDRVSQAYIEYQTNRNYQTIYDKMRMVCKRQKRPDEAAKYGQHSIEYGERVEELRVIIDAEREAERRKYEKKMAARLKK